MLKSMRKEVQKDLREIQGFTIKSRINPSKRMITLNVVKQGEDSFLISAGKHFLHIETDRLLDLLEARGSYTFQTLFEVLVELLREKSRWRAQGK